MVIAMTSRAFSFHVPLLRLECDLLKIFKHSYALPQKGLDVCLPRSFIKANAALEYKGAEIWKYQASNWPRSKMPFTFQ